MFLNSNLGDQHHGVTISQRGQSPTGENRILLSLDKMDATTNVDLAVTTTLEVPASLPAPQHATSSHHVAGEAQSSTKAQPWFADDPITIRVLDSMEVNSLKAM